MEERHQKGERRGFNAMVIAHGKGRSKDPQSWGKYS
jgi:hypothetical protein